MLDHDAFGLAGGAGGVDDVGEVAGIESDGCLDRDWSRAVFARAAVAVQVEDRQAVADSGNSSLQVALREQGDRIASPPA